MNITIDKTLKDITKDFGIGVLQLEVIDEAQNESELDELIAKTESMVRSVYTSTDQVLTNPLIKDARNAYKAYKKDPSRYKLAVESLYRRIVKGNNLYRISPLVDIGNVLSINLAKSVAVLDLDKIEGDVLIRLGLKDEEYQGIGRGSINIENIPLYQDSISAFGSTTSDTPRTMITDNTKNVLVFIISFTEDYDLNYDIDMAKELFAKYCNAKCINSYILE